MSEFEFAPAIREKTAVIIALAGASGSGKTFTALQLALGLARGGKIAVVGSEGRRALHYAPAPGQKPDFVNTFPFDHMELRPPYEPARWLAAFKSAEHAGYAVIIGDSFSDEYVGEGGIVDMKDVELAKMKRPNDAAAWARPKAAHKLVTRWMRTCKSHLIICLRAEEKVKLEKVGGETKVVPIGWQPVCEKTVPFEMMTSIMLHPATRDEPDAPGKPFPIKIEEQHRAFFPLDKKITREAGRLLAEWAAGGAAEPQEERTIEPAPWAKQLRIDALEKAREGSEPFRAWWKTVDRDGRSFLRSELTGLQGIAAEADRKNSRPDNPEEKGVADIGNNSPDTPNADAGHPPDPAGDADTGPYGPHDDGDDSTWPEPARPVPFAATEAAQSASRPEAGEHGSETASDLPPRLAKIDAQLRSTAEGGMTPLKKLFERQLKPDQVALYGRWHEYEAIAKAAIGGMG